MPAERQLWVRLSAFAGTFDMDGTAEVCADPGTGREELLATFAGLIDKSVVLFDGARYRLLDTLREFGAQRLAASGQEQAVRGRHLGRFLAMARYFGEHFLDDDQLARFSGLHAEHANLRAAMEYGLGSRGERRVLDGAGLAIALYGYWHVSGMMREGRYWLGMALDRLPDGPSHTVYLDELTRTLIAGSALRSAFRISTRVVIQRPHGRQEPATYLFRGIWAA
jgi:predicted ATPase